ncbi:ribonuclease HII [Pseudoclavibacter caeni]|uniref:Ribonuclease n=1 Tax=Pseudoclavibacter caeni TaxID=908846 RepID=A0A7C8FUL8_9MICO|nr:ribonuclease HII [Pseudoclavibacter caeni]KAB1632314.1 ribonuclease HII [Pseudoclavibacter caeni]NYJ97548.1 ribonuclease HII [Pseudoclavibacter caeni]
MTVADPTLDLERELLDAGADVVVGCDEVGRGALAGPVAVGAAAVTARTGVWPAGLRDSKMLTDRRRHALVAPLRAWAVGWRVAAVDSARIDAEGIVACLRAAAVDAVTGVLAGLSRDARVAVILDGTADWLSEGLAGERDVMVRVRAKADRDCASVAAASVLAKVWRDDLMVELAVAHPGYGWEHNRGYGSAQHRAAITRLGPSPLHRRTWLH